MAPTASQLHALASSNLKRHAYAKHGGEIKDGRDGEVSCEVCHCHMTVLRYQEQRL